MKIACISLGCPKNQVDLDVMVHILLSAGHETVADLAEADVILVNTCGFIESAKTEAIENILEACAYKQQNPNLKVIVTGCLAERYRSQIEEEIPEVDAVVGCASNKAIDTIVERLFHGEDHLESYGAKKDFPLHITADVSHLSDKGFWDIANHSTRPFAASHSNCRALSPHNRNLTDEMIRALAEKGGIAGLNYCASFVDADSAHPKLCRSTVERLAKHAAHFKQVGGIEVISLGSDFDGIGGQHELETAADMPLLAEALRREGFTEDEVEAIYWRNAYRFFKNNL